MVKRAVPFEKFRNAGSSLLAIGVLFYNSYLSRGGIVTAVIDNISRVVHQLQLNIVLTARPTRQPDRFPFIDILRLAAIHRSTSAAVGSP